MAELTSSTQFVSGGKMASFRLLLIGDVHFRLDNADITDQMASELVALVTREQPDLVAVLGDVLHTHDRISMGPLVRAVDFLERLQQVSRHLIILIGNHDRPNNTVFLTEDHPFTALKAWERTTIVDKVKDQRFPVVEGVVTVGQIRIVSVPYVSPGRFNEALATVGLSPTDSSMQGVSIVLAHQEARNAKMGAILSAHGDVWPLAAPPVFSGHVHDFDVLQKNFIYVGTPIQHGYADKPDKAVMMVHFARSSEDSPMRYSHYIRTTLKVPKKVQIRLTPEELVTFVPEPNTHFKITVMGDPAAIRKVLELEPVKVLMQQPGIKISICDTRPSVAGTALDAPALKPKVFGQRFKEAVAGESAVVQALGQELGLF